MLQSLLPFKDINFHSSPSHYAFTSPSTPNAPTLVVERPNGDLRLNDGSMLGTKRVSSIAGILGIIKLKLGMFRFENPTVCITCPLIYHLCIDRQVYHYYYQGATGGPPSRPYDI